MKARTLEHLLLRRGLCLPSETILGSVAHGTQGGPFPAESLKAS